MIFDAFEYIENLTVSNFSVSVNEHAEYMCFSQSINSNKIKMYKVLSMPNLSLQSNFESSTPTLKITAENSSCNIADFIQKSNSKEQLVTQTFETSIWPNDSKVKPETQHSVSDQDLDFDLDLDFLSETFSKDSQLPSSSFKETEELTSINDKENINDGTLLLENSFDQIKNEDVKPPSNEAKDNSLLNKENKMVKKRKANNLEELQDKKTDKKYKLRPRSVEQIENQAKLAKSMIPSFDHRTFMKKRKKSNQL